MERKKPLGFKPRLTKSDPQTYADSLKALPSRSQALLPSASLPEEEEEAMLEYLNPRPPKALAWDLDEDDSSSPSLLPPENGSTAAALEQPSWDLFSEPVINLTEEQVAEELVTEKLRSLSDWSSDHVSPDALVQVPVPTPEPLEKMDSENRSRSSFRSFFQREYVWHWPRGFSPLGFPEVAVLKPGRGDNVQLETSRIPRCLKERVAAYFRDLIVRFTMMPKRKLAHHMGEIERVKKPPSDTVWVIHPFCTFRVYYVVFMIILTILSLFITPLTMAFQDDKTNRFSTWISLNLFTDMFFLFDLILNFRLGIVSEDQQAIILDPVKIQKSYLKTWFVPDLLSSTPMDIFWLITFADPHSVHIRRLSKFTRLARVLRLLRLPRLARYFQEWEQNNSWVEQYSVGVFRALSQMVGVGYGSNETPKDLLEMWILILCIFSGSMVYVTILANVSAMVTNAEQATKIYREKMQHLTEYMAYRKLPPYLCKRIVDYYETRYQGKWFDEKEILNEISDPLKEEVQAHLCTNLVRKVPLFQHCDVNFVNAVIAGLQYELFLPDDVICQEGSFGDRMFFIEYGKVTVETKYFCKQLMDGDFFGEIALLRKGFRVATVKALTFCSVYSLSAETFQEVFQAYPEMGERVVNIAQKYLEQLQVYEETDQKETSA